MPLKIIIEINIIFSLSKFPKPLIIRFVNIDVSSRS